MRTLVDRLRSISFISLTAHVILLAFAMPRVHRHARPGWTRGFTNAQARYFRQWSSSGLMCFRTESRPPPRRFISSHDALLNLVAAHIYRLSNSRSQRSASNSCTRGSFCCSSASLPPTCSRGESQMHFVEGQTKGNAESSRNNELAFTTVSGNGDEEVVVIPGRLLANGGEIRMEICRSRSASKVIWETPNRLFARQ